MKGSLKNNLSGFQAALMCVNQILKLFFTVQEITHTALLFILQLLLLCGR